LFKKTNIRVLLVVTVFWVHSLYGDPDPVFLPNAEPDPGFKICNFFPSKITFYVVIN
jgi:hypothetical protein